MELAKQDLFVFVNEKEIEVGEIAKTINTYCTSLSILNEDEEYVNAYLDVRFSNNLKEAYKLDHFVDGTCLKVSILDAWLSFRAWENRDGEQRRAFYIFVNDARIEEYVKEEEKPTKKAPAKKKTPAKKTSKR